MLSKVLQLLLICSLVIRSSFAQEYELNSGWKCIQASKTDKRGEEISLSTFPLSDWMPAIVPGTILTTLLHNKLIPDPYFGKNNEKIKDLYDTGPGYYTYWFTKDFNEALPEKGRQIWLHFRGINYSFEVYINGYRVNTFDRGMFLRHTYNITRYLAKDGNNRLAVLVFPPSPPGNPNGGQGGDGMIAHSITNQYVAGWDWIQPIHDRNTGIWDKVTIEKTNGIVINDPHIVTIVPGTRKVEDKQEAAIIKVSATLQNPTSQNVEGYLQYQLGGKEISKIVYIPAKSTCLVQLDDYKFKDPKLWWPNGCGPQYMYHTKLRFTVVDQSISSDEKDLTFGIREIQTMWNTKTQSREIHVNGQKIFIKGGNWIVSDAMLQLSKERYDAQVRFHRDMNLNLIRVWGGGITERPEFYDACDRYGLLVFQEFWISGDCNGRWDDKKKKEDTTARRAYPDDHKLFIESAADQIKMLRNHPSLAFWCGGNEILPPLDLLTAIRDSLLPSLDGTRYFFNYSNDDSMSLHSGDGPYTIQDPKYFWEHKSFPFNSEIGSVGIGDYDMLEKFLPKESLVIPEHSTANGKPVVDPMWAYHKYISYGHAIDAYGKPKDLEDFAKKAQLVNYEQYRSMTEAFSAHMWDWYTGFIIWKTQNPWTALVGEMYDHSLDPNACLYGIRKGGEPIHAMFDPLTGVIMTVNNTTDLVATTAQVRAWDINGKGSTIGVFVIHTPPSSTFKFSSVLKNLNETEKQSLHKADFISIDLLDKDMNKIGDNLYALPDKKGNYPRLQQIPKAKMSIVAQKTAPEKIEVSMTNAKGNPIAYFNRLSLVDPKTKKRILPVFYSDNYVSVLPGEAKVVTLEYTPQPGIQPMLSIEGWNLPKQYIAIP